MVLLELFSGIGGFSKGLQAAGYSFEKVYFSEIEKNAIANFKYNFPYAEHIGSVTEIGTAEIGHPDIITFGSPCQNFSSVGDGSGLRGEASSLVRYAVEAVGRFRPDVFIWENVKGVFFAKHRSDFWSIIKAFADIGGYRLEWQLFNTAWFLPQNTLSDVLQTGVPEMYFLSRRRVEGIIRAGKTRFIPIPAER